MELAVLEGCPLLPCLLPITPVCKKGWTKRLVRVGTPPATPSVTHFPWVYSFRILVFWPLVVEDNCRKALLCCKTNRKLHLFQLAPLAPALLLGTLTNNRWKKMLVIQSTPLTHSYNFRVMHIWMTCLLFPLLPSQPCPRTNLSPLVVP